MKTLIAGTLLTLSGFAFAEGKTFDEKKTKFLTKIDKKITFLEQAKTCVNSASDKPALKQCRKTLKASMKSLKKHKKQ